MLSLVLIPNISAIIFRKYFPEWGSERTGDTNVCCPNTILCSYLFSFRQSVADSSLSFALKAFYFALGEIVRGIEVRSYGCVERIA